MTASKQTAGAMRRLKPRRRRAQVVANLWLCLMIAAPVSYWMWGVYEHRQLDAQVRASRAAGEPVLPEDFNQASSPDPANPVPERMTAAASLDDANEFEWLDTNDMH